MEVPKIGKNTSPTHCKSFSMLPTHLEDFNCYINICDPLLVLECQWVWFLCTSISIIGLRHILATLDELLFVATISSGASLMLSSNIQSWSSSLQPLLQAPRAHCRLQTSQALTLQQFKVVIIDCDKFTDKNLQMLSNFSGWASFLYCVIKFVITMIISWLYKTILVFRFSVTTRFKFLP